MALLYSCYLSGPVLTCAMFESYQDVSERVQIDTNPVLMKDVKNETVCVALQHSAWTGLVATIDAPWPTKAVMYTFFLVTWPQKNILTYTQIGLSNDFFFLRVGEISCFNKKHSLRLVLSVLLSCLLPSWGGWGEKDKQTAFSKKNQP